MASSDNRSAFRLPWQSGHASESEAEAATGTAVVDPPAWPSHDLARRQSQAATQRAETEEQEATEVETEAHAAADAQAASEAQATAEAMAPDVPATAEMPAAEQDATTAEAQATAERAEAVEPAPTTRTTATGGSSRRTATTAAAAEPSETTSSDAAVETTQQRAPMTETMTRPVPEAGVRKPTKFLLDLTRAMRQAADEARQAALTQFRGDVELHTADARKACEAAATEARQRADEDIAALAEWETAEIARIRREAEEGISARHVRLEQEIADQLARLDEEIARVRQRVDAFEAQMDTFFQGLLQEDDPGRFAGLAEQLPEAPAFDRWTPETTTWTPEPVTPEMLAAATPEAMPETAGDGTTAEAEVEAEAASAAMTSDETATEPAMAMLTAGEAPAEEADATTDDGMPPMLPDDFAAAEAEAADWGTEDTTPAEPEAAATVTSEAEAGSEAETTAEADAATPWPPAATPAPTAVTNVRTQVAVVGLVSVASIATFKRLLARAPGVHGVQVASGPDGEFLFTATHDSTMDMSAAVAAIQGFEVEVLDSGPGIVMARAVDPEVV